MRVNTGRCCAEKKGGGRLHPARSYCTCATRPFSAIGFIVLFSPSILLYYFCRSGGAEVGSSQGGRAAAPLTIGII